MECESSKETIAPDKIERREACIQTSIINLRDETPKITKEDASIQTSLINLRSITSPKVADLPNVVTQETSMQTSMINLRSETPVRLTTISEMIKQDINMQTSLKDLRAKAPELSRSTFEADKSNRSIQNSTVNLRSIEQPMKLLPEIKLMPDRQRTLVEDDDHTRQELIQNVTHRTYVDKNCHNVQSITELVEKVRSYSEQNLVRAWLVFYWITKNIKYTASRTDNSVDVVFKTRTGVCRGFTHLFSECCRLMNIECVEVPGFVKENWFRIGDTLQQSTHVWNAVKLNNYWYLLDATWGAGSGEEKRIEEFYFLTPPEQMIYTHLPTEDLWQLLSPAITKQQFIDLPLVKSNYYRLNLKLISPKQCVIETNQSLFEVIVKTPSSDVTLTTTMKVGSDEYPDFHRLCQYDNTSGLTRCYFSTTNDGTYDITIYGKKANETTYIDVIHMRLKVLGVLNTPMFPILYKPFNEHRCTLIEPFRRTLFQGERITIRMHIPDAISVSVHNGQQTLSTYGYENGMLTKELTVEGDVTVYGIFDRTEKLQGICKFNMA